MPPPNGAFPQAQAVAAVTAAIMAQLDGERELVLKLASEALHVADEVSTRQWKQWARSFQWWAGDGIEEPELPGPLLRPYFQMLAADDPRVDDTDAVALLTAAIETSRSTGERFCEAEVLRVRAERQAAASPDAADADYLAAIELARLQGAKMLGVARLRLGFSDPRRPSGCSRNSPAWIAGGHPGRGPSLSLDLARSASSSPREGWH